MKFVDRMTNRFNNLPHNLNGHFAVCPGHAWSEIHNAHKTVVVYRYAGCTRCGEIGINQARYLAKPWEPPKVVGARNIRYISAGKRPAGMDKWPDEQSSYASKME